MSLTIGVGEKRFEVGSDSFLKAFFSTVFARLERESWGAQYPVIMHELYTGRLSHQRAEAASKELERIHTALAQLGPEQAVWDFEDRAARPPWGDEISPNIESLANYFVTSDGRDFLEVLGCALQEAQRSRKDLEIG